MTTAKPATSVQKTNSTIVSPELTELDIYLFRKGSHFKLYQKLGAHLTKENGKITNSEYQKLTNTSKPTATRDLKELESKGFIINKGTKGSSSIYELKS